MSAKTQEPEKSNLSFLLNALDSAVITNNLLTTTALCTATMPNAPNTTTTTTIPPRSTARTTALFSEPRVVLHMIPSSDPTTQAGPPPMTPKKSSHLPPLLPVLLAAAFSADTLSVDPQHSPPTICAPRGPSTNTNCPNLSEDCAKTTSKPNISLLPSKHLTKRKLHDAAVSYASSSSSDLCYSPRPLKRARGFYTGPKAMEPCVLQQKRQQGELFFKRPMSMEKRGSLKPLLHLRLSEEDEEEIEIINQIPTSPVTPVAPVTEQETALLLSIPHCGTPRRLGGMSENRSSDGSDGSDEGEVMENLEEDLEGYKVGKKDVKDEPDETGETEGTEGKTDPKVEKKDRALSKTRCIGVRVGPEGGRVSKTKKTGGNDSNRSSALDNGTGGVGNLRGRKFKCDLCGFCFGQRGALRNHVVAVHEGRRRYICPREGCGRRFGAPGDVTRHVNSVHDDVRPFECAECGSKFGRKSVLKRHMSSLHGKDLDASAGAKDKKLKARR